MTCTPFVSIIIPAKNEQAIIGRCLTAIKNVDYPADRLEVIVVDNGSTDHTAEIVREHGLIAVVQPDLTIAGLRNYGASLAKGDVIAFLDADVVVSPAWLKHGVAALMEEGVGCVGCSPEIPDEATWVEKIWHMQLVSRPEKGDRDWLASMNVLLWKKYFDEMRGFNPDLLTCEDVDFGYRFKKKYRIVSDKKIKAVHYGEAKTLFQLFKKESWRGISNFQGIGSHGIVLRELPSHIVAVYYFVLMLITPLIVLAGISYPSLLIIMATAAFFPLCKALGISLKLKEFRHLFKLLVVWLVYGFARGWSVCRMIFVCHER